MSQTLTENASWPLAMPVFKMDYAHQEYEAKFGKEPRAYGVQTMRYDVDDKGHTWFVYSNFRARRKWYGHERRT